MSRTLARKHIICLFYETPPSETYTLSLHDALPISVLDDDRRAHDDQAEIDPPEAHQVAGDAPQVHQVAREEHRQRDRQRDRKSTRLNSSHANISYAVFCLKKKNANEN